MSPLLHWEKYGLQYNDTHNLEEMGILMIQFFLIQMWLYEKFILPDAKKYFGKALWNKNLLEYKVWIT